MPEFSSDERHRAGEAQCVADVERYGLHVINVAADDRGPGFAYSVGLFRTFAHPELILVGLPRQTMHDLLNGAADAIRAGARFGGGDVTDALLEGYDCTFRPVPDRLYRAYLGWAGWFYDGQPFPALQLVYPDRERRWPWDAGAAVGFVEQQPVLETAPEPDWARGAG